MPIKLNSLHSCEKRLSPRHIYSSPVLSDTNAWETLLCYWLWKWRPIRVPGKESRECVSLSQNGISLGLIKWGRRHFRGEVIPWTTDRCKHTVLRTKPRHKHTDLDRDFGWFVISGCPLVIIQSRIDVTTHHYFVGQSVTIESQKFAGEMENNM